MKHTVPNWHQALIARQVGLDPEGVAVRYEDDTRIVFLPYKTREEVMVEKSTGEVRKT